VNTPIRRILVVRRDNIGDLVCTTQLFEAIRMRFPDAAIHALVNNYNSAVLDGNPNVTAIHVYEKLKHANSTLGIPSAIARRINLLIKLRRMQFDYAIIAGSAFQPRVVNYLRWIRPKHVVGYVPEENSASQVIDLGLPADSAIGLHEVEATFRLLTRLDIHVQPLAVKVYPTAGRNDVLQKNRLPQICVGVHISSRKPSQRWPEDNFVEFIRQIRDRYSAKVILFWSPGAESNKRHPGDDGKAQAILSRLNDPTVIPMPTSTLKELINAMTEPDIFVCSDGGAMHIAAGLAKPILCFFGDSDAAHWHPWGVPYQLLQADSRVAADISTAQAMREFEKLLARCQQLEKFI
jgi:heptosyltransferase III